MKTQPLSRKWKPAEKMELNKPSFALKKKVIQQIINGQISIHAAAIKYDLCRSSIDYWLKKFTTLEQAEGYMEKDKELKKLQLLGLNGTKVTDAGVAEIKAALPECDVKR